MLGAYSASFNIVSNLGIYSWPIDNCLGDEMKFFSALVAVMEVCQFLTYNSGHMHTLLPLTSRPSSKCWVIPGTW